MTAVSQNPKAIADAIKARNAERRDAVLEELRKDSGGWPDHELRGLIHKGYCDEQREIEAATKGMPQP